MKIQIELSEIEVKGIKWYLQSLGEDYPNDMDVKRWVRNIVHGLLQNPHESVSEYINAVTNK